MLTRVTTGHIANLIYKHTNTNLGRMVDLQEQVSSGERVNCYSDDPQGVGLIQRYELMLAENEQYQENITRARNMVEQTDNALLDLVELMREARDTGRERLNATWTLESSQIGATVIDTMIQEVMNVMNQTAEGSSIFAGYRTDNRAFVLSGDEVVYQGDEGVMTAQIGPNTNVAVNIPGTELIGSSQSSLYGYADLAPRLEATDSLADIAYGEGWSAGSLTWTDSTGVAKELDLSGAATVQDVLDLLNAAGLTASISADGTGLTVTDPGGGPLTISDVEDGDAALTLGIVGSSTDGTVIGNDIRLSPDLTTHLSDIEGLGGGLPLGSLEVSVAGVSVVVDLSAATSLDDVKTEFEAQVLAGGLPALTLDVSENSIKIASNSAEVFDVSQVSGDDTAVRLGLVGTGAPHRIFEVLEDLRDALNATDHDAIRRAVGELEAIETNLLQLEMQVGSRENMLDWMEGLNIDRDYNLNRNLAEVRDADLVQVTSELAQAEVNYQASLAVASDLLQMSLFDYL